MNEMFKSWRYWKPIVLIIGGITAISCFFVFSSALLIEITVAAFIIGIFILALHSLGKMSYEDYMYQIKNNYQKLTGKPWDEK